jgi:hypothetical protein
MLWYRRERLAPPTCAEKEWWEKVAQAERVAAEAKKEVAARAVSRVAEVKKEYEAARMSWGPASRVFALPELWGIIAEHSGVAGAWRLTGVCRASREGAKEWLRRLPGLVVCGGVTAGGSWFTSEGTRYTREVWRLDLGELRWERMSDLGCARAGHA